MWLGLSLLRKIRAKRLAYVQYEFSWIEKKPCPEALYDAGSIYLKNKLYVFGGYNSLNKVNDKVFVYECEDDTWKVIKYLPNGFPQSHCSICTDHIRYIYLAGGQIGAQCAPAVTSVIGYDTISNNWFTLPELPEKRYAGTMQLIDGSLYFVGGAKENRHTPASNLWVLDIEKDKKVCGRWHSADENQSVMDGDWFFYYEGKEVILRRTYEMGKLMD